MESLEMVCESDDGPMFKQEPPEYYAASPIKTELPDCGDNIKAEFQYDIYNTGYKAELHGDDYGVKEECTMFTNESEKYEHKLQVQPEETKILQMVKADTNPPGMNQMSITQGASRPTPIQPKPSQRQIPQRILRQMPTIQPRPLQLRPALQQHLLGVPHQVPIQPRPMPLAPALQQIPCGLPTTLQLHELGPTVQQIPQGVPQPVQLRPAVRQISQIDPKPLAPRPAVHQIQIRPTTPQIMLPNQVITPSNRTILPAPQANAPGLFYNVPGVPQGMVLVPIPSMAAPGTAAQGKTVMYMPQPVANQTAVATGSAQTNLVSAKPRLLPQLASKPGIPSVANPLMVMPQAQNPLGQTTAQIGTNPPMLLPGSVPVSLGVPSVEPPAAQPTRKRRGTWKRPVQENRKSKSKRWISELPANRNNNPRLLLPKPAEVSPLPNALFNISSVVPEVAQGTVINSRTMMAPMGMEEKVLLTSKAPVLTRSAGQAKAVTFANKDNRIQKLREQYAKFAMYFDLDLECNICYQLFQSKNDLARHIHDHSDEDMIYFLNLATKQEHAASAGEKQTWTCKKCSQVFHRERSLVSHQKVHYVKVKVARPPMDYKSALKQTLTKSAELDGMEEHVKNSAIAFLENCDYESKGLNLSDLVSAIGSQLFPQEVRDLPLPTEEYKKSDYMTRYKRWFPDPLPHSCAQCPFVFKSFGSLVDHMATHKDNAKENDTIGRFFLEETTSESKKIKSGPINLKNMLDWSKIFSNQTSMQIFDCTSCEESIKGGTPFIIHLICHGMFDRGRYYCDKCWSVVFSNYNSIVQHQLFSCPNHPRGRSREENNSSKSNDLLSFHCHICGSQFQRLSDLVDHKKEAHDATSKDNPDRKSHFQSKLQLNSEMDSELSNPGSSSYLCPICDKEFALKVYLKLHKKLVHLQPDSDEDKNTLQLSSTNDDCGFESGRIQTNQSSCDKSENIDEMNLVNNVGTSSRENVSISLKTQMSYSDSSSSDSCSIEMNSGNFGPSRSSSDESENIDDGIDSVNVGTSSLENDSNAFKTQISYSTSSDSCIGKMDSGNFRPSLKEDDSSAFKTQTISRPSHPQNAPDLKSREDSVSTEHYQCQECNVSFGQQGAYLSHLKLHYDVETDDESDAEDDNDSTELDSDHESDDL